MLVLLFETAGGRYAIETAHVVEVVPFVNLKKIPKTMGAVAGLVNYRGCPVPVVDLNILLEGTASETMISTRILIIKNPFAATDPPALLGVVAPRAMEIFRSKAKRQTSGVLMDEELYNGTIASDTKGMVQLLDLPRLLPEQELADLLQAGE
jgi:chemotaxis-related protein WspB